MSLDVYLMSETPIEKKCECCGSTYTDDLILFSNNITHNLGEMAKQANIYHHLWRPEELGIKKAYALIIPLKQALKILRLDPDTYKKFNPENGWGSYEGLVEFIEDYYDACVKFPNSNIEISR
jgi:hypothetical protein